MDENKCSACKSASTSPAWGEFRAGCRQCSARAASRSPQFYDARRKGVQTREYRALLEQFGLTHEEVNAAFHADLGRAAQRS